MVMMVGCNGQGAGGEKKKADTSKTIFPVALNLL
jgi:hypothetical protein